MAAVDTHKKALQFDDDGTYVPTAKFNVNNGEMLSNFTHMSIEQLFYSGFDPSISSNKMLCLVLLSVKHANEKSDMDWKSRAGQGGGFNNKRFKPTPPNYQRMLVFGDPSTPNMCSAIFEEKDGTTEKLLWQESLNVRSTMKVGDWFAVLEPEPITTSCKGKIQKLDTSWPLIPISPPALVPFFSPPSVVEHQMSFFFHSNALRVFRTTVIENSCGGTFCDRQKPHKDRCGCYSQSSSGGNYVLKNMVQVDVPQPQPIIAEYNSWSFTQFPFIPGAQVAALSPRDIRMNIARIRRGFSDLVQYINDRSGWGIIGWYRLAQTKDGLDDDGTKNMSESVLYHIVSIYPSDPTELQDFKNSQEAIVPASFV